MPVYNPVKEAFDFLQQSVKLSPDIQPRREVAEALADVNSWLGNNTEAINLYKAILNRQPADDSLRNKLVNYLLANSELSAAYEQLDTLYRRKQMKQAQIIPLANYHILSGKYKEATLLLKSYQPQNDSGRCDAMSLYATMNWLKGLPQQALNYLQDSLPIVTVNEKDYNDIKRYKQQQVNFRLYSVARMYSLLKDTDKAWAALKQALDSGFNFKYVLDNDDAWATYRNTEKWDTLIASYNFDNSYATGSVKKDVNPIQYRIPKLNMKVD